MLRNLQRRCICSCSPWNMLFSTFHKIRVLILSAVRLDPSRLSSNLLSARGNWALDPQTRRHNPDWVSVITGGAQSTGMPRRLFFCWCSLMNVLKTSFSGGLSVQAWVQCVAFNNEDLSHLLMNLRLEDPSLAPSKEEWKNRVVQRMNVRPSVFCGNSGVLTTCCCEQRVKPRQRWWWWLPKIARAFCKRVV